LAVAFGLADADADAFALADAVADGDGAAAGPPTSRTSLTDHTWCSTYAPSVVGSIRFG
jgi:hypothetical protein